MNRDALEQLLGMKVPLPPRYSRKGITDWVDLITLLTVLSGATFLGLIAVVGGSITSYLGSGWPMRIICGFIGLSAVWQWRRQPLDSVSLLAVFYGATFLGLLALAGDTITAYLGFGWPMRAIYGVIGLSAIWQWGKQRF
jgi:uncharacterized membrane protein YuzA (DUF378 family)